jgi:DNA-binding response OmpR family regulator
MRALIVEDDPDIGQDILRALSGAGFVVDLTGDGEDAWYRGDVEDYDLVLLDLGLPRLDGLSVLRKWRANGRDHPVLILSARGDWTEKVEGIEAGADDYLAKPFEMEELVTRVRALVRRAAGHASSILTIGTLRIDTRHMRVNIGGKPVPLSPLEFRVVNYLAHQPGRDVPASELAEHLYGSADSGEGNAIEAIVTRLRRKLGADVIRTRRGYGYRLSDGSA